MLYCNISKDCKIFHKPLKKPTKSFQVETASPASDDPEANLDEEDGEDTDDEDEDDSDTEEDMKVVLKGSGSSIVSDLDSGVVSRK